MVLFNIRNEKWLMYNCIWMVISWNDRWLMYNCSIRQEFWNIFLFKSVFIAMNNLRCWWCIMNTHWGSVSFVDFSWVFNEVSGLWELRVCVYDCSCSSEPFSIDLRFWRSSSRDCLSRSLMNHCFVGEIQWVKFCSWSLIVELSCKIRKCALCF